MQPLKKVVTYENEENGLDQQQPNNPGPSTPTPSRPTSPLKPKQSTLAKHVTSHIDVPITEKCQPIKLDHDDVHSGGKGFNIEHEECELVSMDLQYLNSTFGRHTTDLSRDPSLTCIMSSPRMVHQVDSEAQFIAGEIVKDIFKGAFAETCDSIVDSVVNEVLDHAFKSTAEGIATDLVNEMVNNIDDEEVEIYCEEYKTSGNIIQYLAKGTTLRSYSAMPREPLNSKDKFIKLFKQVFLPHGFPESVSADYAEYQTWDTLQAFFSTLTGALTTHAVLKGVGVGDSNATAASAAITWLLKDGTGLVGKILFAWWKGTDFDHDCKKWRLFADILNDAAMFLECLTPHLRSYSVIILCTSTAMKSLVGVAGGATRAALTQHQAIQGNMADVSAKDGSQEACVSLFGSFIGIFLLLTVADGRFKWDLFIFFVFCHLMCNYRAVRAVQMATLNVARFVLIIRCYLVLGDVGSVKTINRNESVFIGRGLTVRKFCGYDIKFGVSMYNARLTGRRLDFLMRFYKHYNYMLHLDRHERIIYVFLKRGAIQQDILKAFYHAMLLGIGTCMRDDEDLEIITRQLHNVHSSPLDYMIDKIIDLYNLAPHRDTVLKTVGHVVNEDFPNLYDELVSKGWNTSDLMFVVETWRGTW